MVEGAEPGASNKGAGRGGAAPKGRVGGNVDGVVTVVCCKGRRGLVLMVILDDGDFLAIALARHILLLSLILFLLLLGLGFSPLTLVRVKQEKKVWWRNS